MKIKANEFRIGNYISLELAEDNTWYECIVVGIEQNKIYYLPWLKLKPKADHLCSLYCYVKPIKLTEEWLIKLGFTNMENICWQRYVQKKWVNFENGFFFFRVMKHSFAWWFILEDEINTERGINMGDIQYVHELQNLYFVLTGKELKYIKK